MAVEASASVGVVGLGAKLAEKLAPGGCVIDVTSALDPAAVRAPGFRLRRL